MINKKLRNVQFKKINELKNLFLFGGEIIPFVEELFIFLNDVLPLIEGVSSSLQETTTNMPKAQDRISKASEETEAATQKIMDKLDSINQRLSDLAAKVQTKNEDKEIQDTINAVQNDTFDIIYALQFQDITAQQLEYAQKILKAINSRLQKLFDAISSFDIDDDLKNIFFNRNTQNLNDNEEKNIEVASKDLIRNEGISQDDIDKLFKT